VSEFVALFTGQGSQFPGMGKRLYEASDAARAVFDEAESIQPGLESLCFEGPGEELVKTENTQPCVLVTDVAAYRAFGRTPIAAAGHSLGEYAALVASGSLDLATAVPLVKERGRAMQDAVPEGVGGMVALLKGDLDEARKVAAEVRSGVCDLANYNSPGQYVLSGEVAAMEEVVAKVGRRARPLPVSVPFHSSLLADAAVTFAKRLDGVAFADTKFPIITNVDAAAVTAAADIRDALQRQFASSVLWQQSIELLIRDGRRRFIEFGPKPTLTRMVSQIAKVLEVEVEVHAVCEPEDLEAAAGR